MSEQQVSHVLQKHYEMSAADKTRIWGLEGVISECVSKVRDMYSEQATLSDEARNEADVL